RIAVLDTGRPHYESEYRTYYRERFGTTIDRHGRNEETDGRRNSRGMFIDTGTQRRRGPKNQSVDHPSSNQSPGPDIDTMITPFGRLTHPHAGHGLFVSSIVARYAPTVGVLALATTSDDSIADLFEILVDLETAREEDCRIVNMSLGFYSEDDACPPSLAHALKQITTDGRLVVASAGNAGRDRPIWPAAHDDVVAVAATDDDGLPAEWSNFGPWVTACAHGQDIVSDYVFADWDYPNRTAKRFQGAARWSGTSFSAPLVAALIARRAMHDDTGPQEAWDALRQLATQPKDHDGIALDGYGVLLHHQY
ncbi:MAG TPA: S8/S53 family peptidase, partial [Acidimicrobiia bacterium]|nr:S8/S53 family peptidase [Acidimicrobiia bacterium]